MRKFKIRTIVASSAILISMSVLPAPVAAGGGDNCQAGSFVGTAAASLMRAANAGSPAALTAAVASFTDINAIALNALGPYRKKLSKARQSKYLELSKAYIGKFLAENAKRFKGSGFTIGTCKMAAGALLVDSTLGGGGHVLWKVTAQTSSGPYRIQDVRVQQVWLVQQLRTNFVYKIRQNDEDVDKFIDQLG